MSVQQGKGIFEQLNNLNVSEYIKKKMGLSYLSWADAWMLLKKFDPDATQKIYTRGVITKITKQLKDESLGSTITNEESYTTEVPYFTDGKTCWVKVGVVVNGIEYVETYPVMDLRNQSVSLSSVKSTDVNKAIQRAFVKACARHGLGLYIFRGEDLPEDTPNSASVAEDPLITLTSIIEAEEKNIHPSEKEFNEKKAELINILQYQAFDDKVSAKIQQMILSTIGKKIGQTTFTEDGPSLVYITNILHKFVSRNK